MPRDLVPALTFVRTGKDRTAIGPEVQPHGLAFVTRHCLPFSDPQGPRGLGRRRPFMLATATMSAASRILPLAELEVDGCTWTAV